MDNRLLDNYMEWLERFTERVDVFIQDDFESPIPLEIGKDNAKFGKDIYLLYDIIIDYAKKNYLSPNYSKQNIFYVIKYHDNFYEIGEDLAWGNEVYCKRLLDYNGEFIDYLDIRNDTIQQVEDTIKDIKIKRIGAR